MFFGRADWIKGLLDPVFEYCENDYWVKKYPPYDIGKYPVASYQIEVNNNGIESAADMLMMVAALVKAEKDFDYANLHWKVLCQWAEYLKESKTEEIAFPSALLEKDDNRVKKTLGLMAYRELMDLKKKY